LKAYCPGETNPWLASLAVCPSQLLYAMETGTFNTCIPTIASELGIETSTAQWLIHIELVICCSVGAISARLAERFGISRVFLFGVWVFSLFTLPLVFSHGVFAGLLVLRVIASLGLACSLPLANPMAYRMVRRERLPVVLTIGSACLPVGQVISSVLSGLMAGSIGWQYMAAVISLLGVVYGIFLCFALPGFRPNKAARIDFLGAGLILLGMCALLFGLTFVAQGLATWGAVLLILLALAILALFCVYNWRWSRAPIFGRDVFNRSSVCNMLTFMLVTCAGFGERFYLPYIMMRVYGLNSLLNGLVNALSGVASVIFSPLWQFSLRRMLSRYLVMIYSVVYVSGCVLEAALLGQSLGLTIFSVILNMLSYMALAITIQTSSLTSAPLRHSATIGSLNTVMMNLGHSLGISVAVSVQSSVYASLTAKNPGDDLANYVDSLSSAVYAMLSFIGAVVILAFFMGVNKQDRGKIGFTEKGLNRSRTFRENKENNPEMVELQGEDTEGRDIDRKLEASLWLPRFV